MTSPADSSPATAVKPTPSRSRGRSALAVVGVLAGVAAIGWGAWYALSGRFHESTDDAYLTADSVTVAPKVAGYVMEVYVKADQAVRADAPLVRLDKRQYEAELDQARATIESRQADIARAKADIVQEKAQIEQAEAQAQAAQATARHAREEVERYQPLAATGAASSERLADLRNTLAQAEANLRESAAVVKAAQGKLASSAAQVAQAEAQVKAGEASLRQSGLEVDDTIVRAAVDGRVGDSTVRVGQFVQPGTRLMSVVPVQQVYLVANFKETQIGRMRIGQPVTVHVDALPGVDIHGTVESFSPGTGSQFALLPPENATGNFTKIVQRVPVRVKLQAGPEIRDRLLPGLSVTAEVDTRDDQRVADASRHG
jgi:membrane fusion protein (multidrug efflux system)